MINDPPFQRKTFPRGTVVFEEGEIASSCLLITLGRVRIVKAADTNHPKELGVVQAGSIIGEMALFGNRRHLATVITETPVEATIMSKAEFENRLADMDPVLRAAIQTMAARARQLADMLTEEPDKGDWVPLDPYANI